MKYVMVRCYAAGVFCGNLELQDNVNRVVVLRNSRRIWKWAGAASLSQLAMEGTKKPEECMFPCEVGRHELFQVEEIIDMPLEAELNIKAVPVWEAPLAK